MPPARRHAPLPAAVLFDWDGTLVDTIPMIYRANVVALREFGITMSREWYRERYTPDWRRSYRELGIPEDQWNDVAARWAAGDARRRGRGRCPTRGPRSGGCARTGSGWGW